MSYEILSQRQISKKLKLTKTVREVYKHSNLNFFTQNFHFDKPLLFLTNEIIQNFSSFLLCADYYFIICSSLCIDQDTEKTLKKLNQNLIFINEEFIDEIFISNENSSFENLKKISKYFSLRYPQATFDILTSKNLEKYTAKSLFYDLTIQKPQIPFNQFDLPNYFRDENLKSSGSTNESPYEEYFENLEMHYKSGEITKGTLIISPINCFEGEVVEKDRRIKIFGKSLNRAYTGDEVFVKDDRIVGICKPKVRIVVGTLIKIVQLDNFNFGLVKPIDRRFPDLYVLTHLNCDYVDRKVVVHIVEWKYNEILPRGVIFKLLGHNGNFEDELTAILEHCNVEYRDETWNEALNRQRKLLGIPSHPDTNDSLGLKCESLGFDKYHFSVERALEEIQIGKRKDFRNLNVCSIDPLGCTDIDDALHCTVYSDYIEVGVHIADVSFYVTENSILDLEAKSRCTTVYMPQRRIDMLPPFLSSNLCSLLENQDRAAFSCIWKFDRNFNVISEEITKSMIRSKASLSYEKAYEIISSDKPHFLKDSLVLLLKISEKLKMERLEKGALELSTQEIYVENKNEKFDLKVIEHVPTHSLVEEFMLLANISIAKFIVQFNPEYSLLRKHPLPSTILLDNIDCSSSKAINQSLQKLDEDQRIITKRIITRSMQQAVYFCSGDSPDYYHYGLAISLYTHFTSPIRRYADLLVHRILFYILENNEDSLDQLKLYVNKEICSKLNFRNRNAKLVGQMVSSLYVFKVLDGDEELESSVVSIKDDGIVIFIRKYGIEAFMKTRAKYNVFDKIKVKVINSFEEYCRNRVFDVIEIK